MIKVTVELFPYGSPPARTIGEMTIINDGSGTLDTGNYTFTFEDTRGLKRTGTVKEHDRVDGVWELLRRILDEHDACLTTEERPEMLIAVP